MRGSLLAVVAIAVVLGLAVVAVVRYAGWLNPPVASSPPPQRVVETVVPPPPPPRVVTYGLQLSAGDTVDGRFLAVRDLRPDEMKEYDANKDAYMPPSVATAAFRYAARDVIADTPLKKTDLEAVKKPEPINARLAPGTRAIDLSVPKELATGWTCSSSPT